MIELYLYGMTHLNSKSHMDAYRAYLSRTMLLASYRLRQLHVLCNAIYMSLHHTHLYGSTHKRYHLDRLWGRGERESAQQWYNTICMYCSGIEWVATAAESLTSITPGQYRQ